MTVNDQIHIGRAKNAVLNYFERTLSIPKIYLDADWNGSHVDVLAINRDGAGDVYAALLFFVAHRENGDRDLVESWARLDNVVDRFQNVQTHFKYIVAVEAGRPDRSAFDVFNDRRNRMYAQDGLGRIGLLEVILRGEEEPITQIAVKPERFRAHVGEIAESHIHQHSADWEIRA
jgi:hypothetical protein